MPVNTNNGEIRKRNRSRIFRCLFRDGPLSKQDIVRSLGISLPTVTQNLNEMLGQGLAVEDGCFQSTGGRKATAYSCNRSAQFAVGLDVTKHHVGIVVMDLGRNILRHRRYRVPFENTQRYFRRLGILIDDFISRTGVDPQKIGGVGIAVPGILSEDGQTVAYAPVLGFTGGSCRNFSRYIPYPCVLCNDANAAGFAELWNAETMRNVVYLSLSDSVGGSILIDGRIYPGENQRSGEFGHMTIVPDGRPCYCGRKGCVDAYCSARVLSDSADGSLPRFFRLLREGNAPQEAVWKEYLHYLALTVNNLRMLFDCEVILGGYVGGYLEDYIGSLRDEVSRRNTFGKDGGYLKVCRYKLEAIAVGAALMVIGNFVRNV